MVKTKEKKETLAQKEVRKIRDRAEINENYFVGLLWSDPIKYYTEYQKDIETDYLIHDVWKFFYELGRKMYLEDVKKFDSVVVQMKVKEYNVELEFQNYGGLATIEDSINIVKENTENVSYYADQIHRNYIIRALYESFGEKIFKKEGKYDYEKMNGKQLAMYWQDKVNKIALNNIKDYEIEDLWIDADTFIQKTKEDAGDMMPFYKSNMMNQITQGIAKGHVLMLGGFGNSGKSSLAVEKIVMSYLEGNEKAIILLNEEGANAFRQKLLLSILYHEVKNAKGFNRKHLVNGQLTSSDEEQIRMGFRKLGEFLGTEDPKDESNIKVVFMNKYNMDDLESIVRYHANRGYDNLIIDTHKVSENSKHDQRWATFVEDMKTIYGLTRAEAGGCNLRTVVTFQLADSHIKDRFLTFDAMGEGKAAKNEASTMFMFRSAWSDEYEGGRKELDCWKYRMKTEDELILNPKDKSKYIKEHFVLEKGKVYYLLFTPKNRSGDNSNNGQPILVLEPNFNFNHFKEIGWTHVEKDFA